MMMKSLFFDRRQPPLSGNNRVVSGSYFASFLKLNKLQQQNILCPNLIDPTIHT